MVNRQRSYLAKGLQGEYLTWNDETVFQESRRILGPQIGHISYNEFLPALLGQKLDDKKGLLPQNDNLDESDTCCKRQLQARTQRLLILCVFT